MSKKNVKSMCGKVGTITAKMQFDAQKPRYNAWAVGHGVIGDVKYNRKKENRNFNRMRDEY